MGHMPVAPPLSSLRLGSEWVLTCTGHALEEQGFLPCLHTVMIRWMDRPMSVRSHGAHGGEARTTVKHVYLRSTQERALATSRRKQAVHG